jgi:predicted PhzF superfamily epimerase YddE/YHI9
MRLSLNKFLDDCSAGLAVSQPSLGEKYTISQGTKIGRQGRIQISNEGPDQIWVGGHATVCISGQVRF